MEQVRHVLIVDPECPEGTGAHALGPSLVLTTCRTFDAARRQLFQVTPDVLVTNVRLGSFNGLHLVHLAIARRLQTRLIVYGYATDVALAHEARSLGAFFELVTDLPEALAAHLGVAVAGGPVESFREMIPAVSAADHGSSRAHVM